MNQIKFKSGKILACILNLILSCQVALSASQNESSKPNIVFILCDDLGWADLACYGADLHETPNIDQLAKHSALFTNAYSAAPVCSPTRAALMTGLHPARISITIWSEGATNPDTSRKLLPGYSLDYLPQKYETIAEKLQTHGYHTAIVGKWHLGNETNAPETQGFEVNTGGTHWGAPPTFFWPYRNNTRFRNEFRFVPGLNFGKPGDYLTDKLTDRALELIDQAGQEPFFLYMSHYAPHTPIEATEKLVKKYELKLRLEYHHQNPTYAAMIENLDFNVGRIINHLKKIGKYDNTLIVFTSDNGGYLGNANGRNGVVTTNAPLRSGKGALYEGGIRVPLLIKTPGNTKNQRKIGERVVTYDLHQTILRFAGLALNEGLDGLDLSPLIADDADQLKPRPIFFHYPHYYETTTPVSSVISDHYKLLKYDEDDQVELYDLESDPYETSNIAVAEPEITQRLMKLLNDWKKQVSVATTQPNPNYQEK